MAGIIKLLETIGEENIGVQALHQCMSKSDLGAKKSSLTIETDVVTTANAKFVGDEVKLDKTALIVWVDGDKFDKALADLKGQ